MVERLSAGGGGGDGFVEGRRSARAAAEVLDWGGSGLDGGGDLWCGRGEEGEDGGRGRGGEGEGRREGSVCVVVGGLRGCCFGRWLV